MTKNSNGRERHEKLDVDNVRRGLWIPPVVQIESKQRPRDEQLRTARSKPCMIRDGYERRVEANTAVSLTSVLLFNWQYTTLIRLPESIHVAVSLEAGGQSGCLEAVSMFRGRAQTLCCDEVTKHVQVILYSILPLYYNTAEPRSVPSSRADLGAPISGYNPRRCYRGLLSA